MPFRPWHELSFEELGRRGTAFQAYKMGQTLPESQELLAAAAFGDLPRVDYLLYKCGAHPDPPPFSAHPASPVLFSATPAFSTPILAAIGGPIIDVIHLIITHPLFDPTKGFDGASYAEIAEIRRGVNWQDEVKWLRAAYSNGALGK